MNGDFVSKFSGYAQRLEEEKKIRVYYIPAYNPVKQSNEFFYAVVSSLLHEKFMEALEFGVIPDFAVVVETGDGEPTPEIKDKMKRYYGFDHDLHAANSNTAQGSAEAAG